jgi:hypothetical protein
VLTEFLLAVAAGVIVDIVAVVFRRQSNDPRPALEIKQRSETVVTSTTTIVYGPLSVEVTQTERVIKETTFEIPRRDATSTDYRAPLAIGVLTALIVLTVLVLVGI